MEVAYNFRLSMAVTLVIAEVAGVQVLLAHFFFALAMSIGMQGGVTLYLICVKRA